MATLFKQKVRHIIHLRLCILTDNWITKFLGSVFSLCKKAREIYVYTRYRLSQFYRASHLLLLRLVSQLFLYTTVALDAAQLELAEHVTLSERVYSFLLLVEPRVSFHALLQTRAKCHHKKTVCTVFTSIECSSSHFHLTSSLAMRTPFCSKH